MKAVIVMISAMVALFASSYVNAFTTYTCGGNNMKWSVNSKIIYAYRGDFPVGSGFEKALKNAMHQLNDNPSHFKFVLQFTWLPPAKGNGRSEIWINNITSPGIAYTWWNGNCASPRFTEKDIIMDSSVLWSTSIVKTTQWSYGGPGRPFQTTLLHELGHALGLLHEADEYNIMGQDWTHLSTNGNFARAYFGEDAGDGAVYLYGNDGSQDLGVVHWRYTGASGAYSIHGRTRLLNSVTNAELGFSMVGGEKRYNVNRGQKVKIELTFENNGNSYQYEDVGYYVSTNNIISTWDNLLATRNLGLSPDNVYTSSYPVTIPNNLKCSTNYWLGAVIDKNRSLAEFHEWNNASYIPIRINWNIWSCLVFSDTLQTSAVLKKIQ